MIAKITNNFEKFNYNVIIANMYETYNFLINYLKKVKDLNNLEDNYKKILICFTPVIPHFTNQCISELNTIEKILWPTFDSNLIEDEKISIVIQVNGKKRSVLKANRGILEKDLLNLVKKDKSLDKYLNKANIKKVIFVKDRLMNFLIK